MSIHDDVLNPLKELDNFDLVGEYGQLEAFDVLLASKRLDANDFNHCLFEKEVDRAIQGIDSLIVALHTSFRKRKALLYREMERRAML